MKYTQEQIDNLLGAEVYVEHWSKHIGEIQYAEQKDDDSLYIITCDLDADCVSTFIVKKQYTKVFMKVRHFSVLFQDDDATNVITRVFLPDTKSAENYANTLAMIRDLETGSWPLIEPERSKKFTELENTIQELRKAI